MFFAGSLKADPDFALDIAQQRARTALVVMDTVVERIKTGDVAAAIWWLARVFLGEFGRAGFNGGERRSHVRDVTFQPRV